jgi:hypothetical protein
MLEIDICIAEREIAYIIPLDHRTRMLEEAIDE